MSILSLILLLEYPVFVRGHIAGVDDDGRCAKFSNMRLAL